MSTKKILDNLYLVDLHNNPHDADLVISCVEEIFREQVIKHKIPKTEDEYTWTDDKHVYFNFKDYPIW